VLGKLNNSNMKKDKFVVFGEISNFEHCDERKDRESRGEYVENHEGNKL
jgi:hypothetical protein